MKTTELIKQAEELLKAHDTAFTNERDMVIIATFARNHMQEIVDKLKRYEEAFYELSCMNNDDLFGIDDSSFKRIMGRLIAIKALEEK